MSLWIEVWLQLPTCCIRTLLSPSKVNCTSYSALAGPTRLSVFKPWPPHASRHSCKSIMCIDERQILSMIQINLTHLQKAEIFSLLSATFSPVKNVKRTCILSIQNWHAFYISGQNCCHMKHTWALYNEPVWLVSRRQVTLQARKEQQTNLEGANPMPGQHRLQTTWQDMNGLGICWCSSHVKLLQVQCCKAHCIPVHIQRKSVCKNKDRRGMKK